MAAFEEFTFPSSTGKNTIYAKKCLPDGQPRGVVQIAHGIAEHIDRYDGFMKFLADNGFVAVGNDHLGHGKSASHPSEKGIFDEKDGWMRAVEDMNKLHELISAEFPGVPYIFFGHSMGSFLTRTYLIRYPDTPDLAVICGTGNQAKASVSAAYGIAEGAVKLGGPRQPGERLNEIAFGAYNKAIEDPRTDYDWLSRDPEIIDRYIADPDCGFIPTVSMFRDMMYGIMYITDPENLAKMNKELPVMFIAGWKDPVGDYGKGVKRAFKAFCDAGMKHVRIKLYPDARHELLNELNKDEVMGDILKWIDEKLAT